MSYQATLGLGSLNVFESEVLKDKGRIEEESTGSGGKSESQIGTDEEPEVRVTITEYRSRARGRFKDRVEKITRTAVRRRRRPHTTGSLLPVLRSDYVGGWISRSVAHMDSADPDLEEGEIIEEDGGNTITHNGFPNVRRPISAPDNIPQRIYGTARHVTLSSPPPRQAGRGLATYPRPGSSRSREASARVATEYQQRSPRNPPNRNQNRRNDSRNYNYRRRGRRDGDHYNGRSNLDTSNIQDIDTRKVCAPTRGRKRGPGSQPEDKKGRAHNHINHVLKLQPILEQSVPPVFLETSSLPFGIETEADPIDSDSDSDQSIKSIPIERKIPEVIVLDGSSSNDEDEETLQLRWLALEGLVKISESHTPPSHESDLMAANAERTLSSDTSKSDDSTELTYSRFESHLRKSSTKKEFSAEEESLVAEGLPTASTSSQLDKSSQESSTPFGTGAHPSDSDSRSEVQYESFGTFPKPLLAGPPTDSAAHKVNSSATNASNQIGNTIQTLISRRHGAQEEHTIPLFQTPDRGFWALSRLSTSTSHSDFQDSPMNQNSHIVHTDANHSSGEMRPSVQIGHRPGRIYQHEEAYQRQAVHPTHQVTRNLVPSPVIHPEQAVPQSHITEMAYQPRPTHIIGQPSVEPVHHQAPVMYPAFITNHSYHSIHTSLDQFKPPSPASHLPLAVSPVNISQMYHNGAVSAHSVSPLHQISPQSMMSTRHSFNPSIYHHGTIPHSASIPHNLYTQSAASQSAGSFNQPVSLMLFRPPTPSTQIQRSGLITSTSPSGAIPSMFHSPSGTARMTHQNVLPFAPPSNMSSGYVSSLSSHTSTGRPLLSQSLALSNPIARRVTSRLPLVHGLPVGDLRITIPNKSLVINVGNESSSDEDEHIRRRLISSPSTGLDRRSSSTRHDTSVHQTSQVSSKTIARRANASSSPKEVRKRRKSSHTEGEGIATSDVAGSIRQMLTRSRKDAEQNVLTEKKDQLEASMRKKTESTSIPEKRRKHEAERKNDSDNSSQGLPEVETSRAAQRISPIRVPTSSPELIPSVIKHLSPLQQAEYAVMKAKIIEYERAKSGASDLSSTISAPGQNSPRQPSSASTTGIIAKKPPKSLSALPTSRVNESSIQSKTALKRKSLQRSDDNNECNNESLGELQFSEVDSVLPEAQELTVSVVSSPDGSTNLSSNSVEKETSTAKGSADPSSLGLAEVSNLDPSSSEMFELGKDREPALADPDSNKEIGKGKTSTITTTEPVKIQPKALRKAGIRNRRFRSKILIRRGGRRPKPKDKEPASIYNKQVDERKEVDLRQRLLKATLLRKMAASRLQLQLAKTENELLSTRANTIGDVNKLMDKVMQISVRKVNYRNIIARVAQLREQMLKADQEAGLSRLTIQGMVNEVLEASNELQQKREVCDKLSEECISLGAKTGSCYKIPERGNAEMVSKLNELKRHADSLAKESVTPATIYCAPVRRDRRSARSSREDTRAADVIPLERAEQPLLPVIKQEKEKRIGFTKCFFLPGSPTQEEVFLLPSTTHDVLGMADLVSVEQSDCILENFFEYQTPFTSKPFSQMQTEQVSIERLDPDISLCSFELQGMCISDTCLFQHLNPQDPPTPNSTS